MGNDHDGNRGVSVSNRQDRLTGEIGRPAWRSGIGVEASWSSMWPRHLAAHTAELIGVSDGDDDLLAFFGADDVCELVGIGRACGARDRDSEDCR